MINEEKLNKLKDEVYSSLKTHRKFCSKKYLKDYDEMLKSFAEQEGSFFSEKSIKWNKALRSCIDKVADPNFIRIYSSLLVIEAGYYRDVAEELENVGEVH